MNKGLKSLISAAITAAFILNFFTISPYLTVKAEDISNQTSYSTSTASNDSLGGFKLVSQNWSDDLKCNVYIYKHAKSGAQLIYLKNDSDTKTMCMNFRTPAKDDTGVNHVIEHSVLCGSKILL